MITLTAPELVTTDFTNYPAWALSWERFHAWRFPRWGCMPGDVYLDDLLGADRHLWPEQRECERRIWLATGYCPHCRNNRLIHARHDINELAWVDAEEPCECCHE